MQKPDAGQMLETALALAEQGFHVIPLGDPWSQPPAAMLTENGGDLEKARYAWSKKARIKWQDYQHRAPTEDEVRGWWSKWPWANVGIITGINVVVLDADTPEAAAWIDSGAITRTPWAVGTPRSPDSGHRYFRVNPSLRLMNSAAAGLDIRGVGGYVVAAGSTGGNFRPYCWRVDIAWAADSVADLPTLTAQDMAAIYAWRGRSQPANAVGDATGDVLGELGALRLPHDGAPVQPGGRNNALASLVGQWVSQKLSLAEILAHGRIWNAQNPAPLADAEIIQTVTSIVMGHQRRHGESVPLAPASPASQDGLKIWTLGELDDAPPEVPQTFWGHGVLFRQGRVMIAGAPKIGKSNFALALGIAAATGGEFLDETFERPLSVLWFQAEIHIAFLRQRIERFVVDLDGEDAAMVRRNLSVTGRVDLDLTDATDFALVEQVIDDRRPDIVIFDPVINFSTAEENDAPEVRALLRQVDRLAARYGCATVLVHHTKKGPTAGDFDSVRGSGAFRGWFDTGLLLTGDSRRPVLSYEIRNAAPRDPQALELLDSQQGGFKYSLLDLDDHQAEPEGPTTRQGRYPGQRGHLQAGRDHDRTDRTEPTDLKTEQDRLARAVSIVRTRPGIGSGELVEALTRAWRPSISQRTAENVVRDLKNSGLVQLQQQGRHVFFHPVVEGE